MPDVRTQLHRRLEDARTAVLATLDGVSEYDAHRPMTPTGTNLLGLVKHLAGLEPAYLSEPFGVAAPEVLPWVSDGSIWEGADMWATERERIGDLTGLYRRMMAHADRTIAALALDTPATVAHWPADRRETTLGALLVLMVGETAQHAGHAEIVRELVDGRVAVAASDTLDAAGWAAHVARVQAAADAFRE
jgi:hypothetical protein